MAERASVQATVIGRIPNRAKFVETMEIVRQSMDEIDKVLADREESKESQKRLKRSDKHANKETTKKKQKTSHRAVMIPRVITDTEQPPRVLRKQVLLLMSCICVLA